MLNTTYDTLYLETTSTSLQCVEWEQRIPNILAFIVFNTDNQHLHIASPSSRPRTLGEKGYSCAREPIFKSVPIDHVEFDTYMYLRITDRLMKKIMQMINELDMREMKSELQVL